MGGNGTASVLGYVENKEYISHGTYTDPVFGEIEIIEWTGNTNRTPAESNSAPRLYVTFFKNGSGVNDISKYGPDHKKEWSIHTQPHDSAKLRERGKAILGPHYHPWVNGAAQEPKAFQPDDPRIGLLQRVQNFQKTKK